MCLLARRQFLWIFSVRRIRGGELDFLKNEIFFADEIWLREERFLKIEGLSAGADEQAIGE